MQRANNFKITIAIVCIFSLCRISFAQRNNEDKQLESAPFYELSTNQQEELLRYLIKQIARKKHPYLLFHDVKRTTGWKNRNKQPWKTFLSQIYESVEKNVGIACVWKGPLTGAIVHTDETYLSPISPAFLYQLTRNKQYLQITVKMLKSATGKPPITRWNSSHMGRVFGRELLRYAVAYDLIQDKLSKAEDKAIRDNLARIADKACRSYRRWKNFHDRIILDCGLGAIACALADYEGPTVTKPVDWLRRGTVNLFIKDDYPWPGGLREDSQKEIIRPAVCGSCSPGGFFHGYFSYWSGPFTKWIIIYSQSTSRNALVDFPIARGIVNTILWESTPYKTDSHHCTKLQNYYWFYHVLWHLVLPEERWGFRWHEKDPRVDELRYRRRYGDVWGGVFSFCFYNPNLPIRRPNWTTFFSPANQACVFRNDWSLESDWLFFNCENYPAPSHRWMLHNDNMSFEYYSHGDYLLADNGEVKERMYGYGPTYASGHNTLLIDGSGPIKEDIKKECFRFVNPAKFINHSLERWLEFAEAEMDITHIEKNPLKGIYAKPLKSPVNWNRTILYPNKQYLIIADRVESAQRHDYSLLFHLTSLNIIKSQGKRLPGQVKGKLFIEDKEIAWDKNVRTDILTGKNPQRMIKKYRSVSKVAWQTNNLINKQVELRLVPIPSADEVTIGRTWGHIPMIKAPYKGSSDVDHPYIAFHYKTKNLYAIVPLLVFYKNEPLRKVKQIRLLSGNGCAVEIEKHADSDIVSIGSGKLRFADIETDADLTLIHKSNNNIITCMIIRGSMLKRAGRFLIETKPLISHIAYNISPQKHTLSIHVNANNKGTNVRIFCPYRIKNAYYQIERKDWDWLGKPHPLKTAKKPFSNYKQKKDFLYITLDDIRNTIFTFGF